MTEENIERLFREVSSHFDIIPEDAKDFFYIFVRETLIYRDEIVKEGKKPLTVEEVQNALNIVEDALKTKKLPQKVPPRTKPLIKRWLTSLNKISSGEKI